jgi:hypothetical protein
MSQANEVDGIMFQETEYFVIIYLHGAKAVHQKEMQKIQHPGSCPWAYLQLLQEPEISHVRKNMSMAD